MAGTGERLTVKRPYPESLLAVGAQLTARLPPQFTFSMGPRIQHKQLTRKNVARFHVAIGDETPN